MHIQNYDSSAGQGNVPLYIRSSPTQGYSTTEGFIIKNKVNLYKQIKVQLSTRGSPNDVLL